MSMPGRTRRRGRVRRAAIAAAIGASSLALPSAALAQTDPYSGGGPEVLPTRLEVGPDDPGPDPATRAPSGGALPVTGAELTLVAVTGLAAIRTGATILRRTRR